MTTRTLVTNPNLGTAADDVYAALLTAHEGLTDAESRRLNARLVLLLVNHVGDRSVIEAALAAAREGLGRPDNGPERTTG